MSERVSVIIPAYNSSATIGGALESAWDQGELPHEVIVVDDASEDRERLEEVLAPWRERGRVHLLAMDENRGPAAARNRGIAHSSGDFIALLDADDRFERDRIEAALEVFRRHPTVAMTCSDAYVVQDGDLLPGLKNDALRPIERRISFERLLGYNCICALTVTMRREIFDRYGPFDEDPAFVAVEDYDLWLRIAKDCDIRYIDRPLGCYTLSAGSLSADPWRLFEGVCAIFSKLEKAIPDFEERYGEIPRRRRRAMRLDLVYHLIERGERRRARGEILRLLREKPLSPRSFRLLLKATIGL